MIPLPWLAAVVPLALAKGAHLEAQEPALVPKPALWSRFRGPNGSGVNDGIGMPRSFEVLRWRTPTPLGFSSPVVGEELVFLTAHEGVHSLAIAIDVSKGVERWRRHGPRELPAPQGEVGNNPVSGTPVTDGRQLTALFGDFGLVSFDAEGRVRWQRELAPFRAAGGMATSLILCGSHLVLQCDQEFGSYLASFDVEDGREQWRTPRVGIVSGFGTPVLRRAVGGSDEIVTASSHVLAGFDLATGAARWELPGCSWLVKASPVVDGARIYATWNSPDLVGLGFRSDLDSFARLLERLDRDRSGSVERAEFEGEALAAVWDQLDLDVSGALDDREWTIARRRGTNERALAAHELEVIGDFESALWRHERSAPEFTTPLVYRGRIYTIRDGGVLHVLDASTGKLLSDRRVPGSTGAFFASPVAADGVLLLADHGGVLSLLREGDEPELLAQRELDEPVIATPALIPGAFLVRSYRALYCFGAKPR